MSCNTCLDSNFYNQKATYYLEEFNIPVNVSKQILKVLYTSLDSCGLDCCNGTFVGGSMLSFQDEGSTLTGNTDNINFVGDGVVATKSGNTITVTISNNSSNSLTDGTYGDIIVSNGTLTWTVADGSITNSKLANGAVTANKLAQMGATNGQVLKWNGTTWAPGTDLEGVTGSTGVTQILAGTNIGISPVNGTGVVTINNTGPVGEINIGANVGLGEGNVYKNKTGTTLNFKKLHAGSGISITDGTDIVTIATTGGGGGGGSVTSVNVSGGTTGLSTSGGPITLAGTITLGGTLAATHGGTGWSAYSIGDILYADTATTLTRRSIGSTGQVMVVVGNSPVWITPPWITNIIAGSGISVTPAGSVVTIAATAVSGGSGEANTGSNVGAGAGVFAQKSGVDLQFKSIVAGSNISIVTGATTITINGTGVSGTTGGWDLNGNAGTVAGTNFIGTTDNVDVVFKRNNVISGRLGGSNTSFGENTFLNNTTGFDNTANGANALISNTTGKHNTAIGFDTLRSNTTVSELVAVGYQALYSNTTGISNVALGYTALKDNTVGSYNTAIGHRALEDNTTGNANTAIGMASLDSNTTGYNNTANGFSALAYNTTGNNNTANGSLALNDNTTGDNNVAIGYEALQANTTVSNLVAVGYQALYSNTTGEYNTAVGYESLKYNTTGSYNTGIGRLALTNNTTGQNNIAIGNTALVANMTGNHNTAVGGSVLNSNSAGVSNSGLGQQALYANTTGSFNTAIGANSLFINTIGNYNTGIGITTLDTNETGNNNTALGYAADVLTSAQTYSTVIGAEAIVSTDNTIKLGRSTEDSVVIGQNGKETCAKLTVTSTSQGFLPPRMTGTQAEAISGVCEGLMIYATDGSGVTITTKGWWGYEGSTWVKLNT